MFSNNDVLICGGNIGAVLTSSCELYQAGAFVPTSNNMSVTRELHTSTMVASQVLLCGGMGGNARSCDLYNPSTKLFVRTGDMNTDRQSHTATLLPNLNIVLICGGASGAGIQNTCETFSPVTGSFTTVNHMASPRVYFSATVLLNQNVLVCGGSNGSAYLSSCEEYDIISGVWSSSFGSMIVPRELHTATRMTNQNLVLLCGGDTGSSSWSSCELFNAVTGLSTLVSQAMSAARTMHSATLLNILSTDLILICGGDFGSPINGGGISFQYSCDMYNSSSGTITQTFGMKTARAVHTATLLNGPVMVCGGLQNSVFLKTCEFYDTCKELFSAIFVFSQKKTKHFIQALGFLLLFRPKVVGT
jgi:hypothetical protein